MSAGGGTYTQDGRIGKLTTALGKDALLLVGLTATERLSESYTVTVDAFSQTPKAIHTLLGTDVGVTFESGEGSHVDRDFAGVLWEYSELGRDGRGYLYRLVLRPTMEFLTLNRRNRIFQNKSIVDIIKPLFAGTYEAKLAGAYSPLEYCVQYQESDFAFVSRLMEYEGIYYFYEHKGNASKLVVVDERNAHLDMVPGSYRVEDQADRRPDAPVWTVTERRGVGPAKVSVADYDFEMPNARLLGVKSTNKPVGTPTIRGGQSAEGNGGSWATTAEMYEFPGKVVYKTNDPPAKNAEFKTAERYSNLWLETQRRRMARSFADGALFAAQVGRRLTLEYDDNTSAEYLIVATSHDYTAPSYDSGEGEETFLCSLELMPASEQYRPGLLTPRPRVLGPQTAIVVGPAGEEIYTDKYGRIKVQFHWDREGKKDSTSSCYVRVAQSVAGKGWGSFALPRIGHEVIITFLDGDPDRPLVTGSVYNAENMPPAELPANMTQQGIKTRSTKQGTGFNRLWFEDKKGSEVVWFRAEKDYDVLVQNHETRLYSGGNRTTTIEKGDDEKIIKTGHLTTTIKKGNEIRTIETGNLTTTIKTGNETHEVSTGNRETTIKTGNETLKVDKGNLDIKVALGNIAIKAAAGAITIEAMQSIQLKVGGNSITIDQTGVAIKGIMVKAEGTAMLQTKAPMSQHSGDGLQIIKGGLVMIN